MFKQLALIAAIAGTGALTGCVVANPNAVSAYDAQRMSTVLDATVLSVRPVTLQGRDTGVGTVSGAVIGGIAGSTCSSGRESVAIGVVGAVAGALAGHAIERAATRE
ncbi:MAG TPA: glycine zipper 2TM domain-containing protein, partial [Burkholderiaceae bacterium]